MFFALSDPQLAVLSQTPVDLEPINCEYRGIQFTLARRSYGLTLFRMNAFSPESNRRFELSIGLTQAITYGRPELRVDFVQQFHPDAHKTGKWLSPFNRRDHVHVAVVIWARDAFLAVLPTWGQAAQPSADDTEPRFRQGVAFRRGTSYTTQAGKVITRSDGPVKAAIVGGTPEQKAALAQAMGLH